MQMKHLKWLCAACILGYYIFAVVGTYVVPVSYDAWVTATCILIFTLIGLYFLNERKAKDEVPESDNKQPR